MMVAILKEEDLTPKMVGLVIVVKACNGLGLQEVLVTFDCFLFWETAISKCFKKVMLFPNKCVMRLLQTFEFKGSINKY